MSSRFGTGDAEFHYGGDEGPTDTVYLGVFDRKAIERVGLYDERLVRNQDYELNIRLRQTGGVVWFDPAAVRHVPATWLVARRRQAVLRVRPLEALVVRQHPRSLRWRQAVPPAVTAAVVPAPLAGWSGARPCSFPAATPPPSPSQR